MKLTPAKCEVSWTLYRALSAKEVKLQKLHQALEVSHAESETYRHNISALREHTLALGGKQQRLALHTHLL